MQLLTERLVLREYTPADEPAFLAYQGDPRALEFYSDEEARPEQLRELIPLFMRWAAEEPRRNWQLAIAERAAPARVIGSGALRAEGLAKEGQAELGLELSPAYWGRGYASEAARALLDYGFRELGLREVLGVTVSANARIATLVRRLGFVTTGSRAGPAWMTERGWDYSTWRLTRERWEELAGA